MEKDQPTEREGPHHLRASEVGECHNRLVLDWTRRKHVAPREPSLRTWFGSIFHDAMRNEATNAGFKLDYIERDFRLNVKHQGTKILFTGHTDFAVIDYKNGIATPWDIKTASEANYEEQRRALSRSYEWQISIYMEMLAKTVPDLKVTHGMIWLVQIDRMGDWGAIEVKRDPKRWTKILNHAASVVRHRKAKEDGRQEYTKDKFPCTYCTHARKCWNLPAKYLAYQKKEVGYSEVKALAAEIATADAKQRKYAKLATKYDGRRRAAALKLLKEQKARTVVVPAVLDVGWNKRGLRVKVK